MKIEVTLNGTGGELARTTLEVHDENNEQEMNEQIHDAIYEWSLAPGDTIKIREV